MRIPKQYILRIILVPCLLIFGISVDAQEFEVKGTITYKSIPYTSTYIFECFVSGCKWLVRTRPSTNTAIQFFQASSDGIESVCLEQYTTNQLLRSGVNVGNIRIFPFDFPPADISRITPVWLAYASDCHLRQATNGRMHSMWANPDLRVTLSEENTFPVKMIMHSQLPRVPEGIDFLSEGFRLVSKDDKVIRQPWPAPYDKGFLAARFTASEWTKIGSITLPVVFQLAVYAPKPNSISQDDLSSLFEYHGHLDSYTLGCSVTNFRPAFSGTFGVHDFRFKDEIPKSLSLGYRATNGAILGKTNEHLLRQRGLFRQNELGQGPESGESHSTISLIVIFVVCIGSLSVLARVISVAVNKKTNK